MSAPLRYKGVVLLKRLRALPDSATTKEVKEKLLISTPTLNGWIADPYFQANMVAVQQGRFWFWNREKLIIWLMALGTLKLPKTFQETNPSDVAIVDKASARKALRMPKKHTVWG